MKSMKSLYNLITNDQYLKPLTVLPWKNGKGYTTVIDIFPPLSSITDFDWRISSAIIDSTCEFSIFPDIDRVLLVLCNKDSIPLTLDFKENETESNGILFKTDSCIVYKFKGESKVIGILDSKISGGIIRDFNVMTRRSKYIQNIELLTHEKRSYIGYIGEYDDSIEMVIYTVAVVMSIICNVETHEEIYFEPGTISNWTSMKYNKQYIVLKGELIQIQIANKK